MCDVVGRKRERKRWAQKDDKTLTYKKKMIRTTIIEIDVENNQKRIINLDRTISVHKLNRFHHLPSTFLL
jgi:hypothetical protein